MTRDTSIMSPRHVATRCPKCSCGLQVANLPDITCIGENLYICTSLSGHRYTFSVNAKTCHKILIDHPCGNGTGGTGGGTGGGNSGTGTGGGTNGNTGTNGGTPGGNGCSCHAEVADFIDITCLGQNYYSCTTNDGTTYEFQVDPENCKKVHKNSKCARDNNGVVTTGQCNCMEELTQYKNVRCVGQDVYTCTRNDGRLWRFESKSTCENIHDNNICAVGPDDSNGGNGTGGGSGCSCVNEVSHFRDIKCLGDNIWQCTKRNGNSFVFTIEGNCRDAVANARYDQFILQDTIEFIKMRYC